MDQAQAAMERAVGLRPEHVDAVSFSMTPKGVPVRSLRAAQREVLRALLDVYVGRVPEELADVQAAKYAADAALDDLSFAWAGGLEPGATALLPGPGRDAAGRVRQHPARRQPRPHGVARPRPRHVG